MKSAEEIASDVLEAIIQDSIPSMFILTTVVRRTFDFENLRTAIGWEMTVFGY